MIRDARASVAHLEGVDAPGTAHFRMNVTLFWARRPSLTRSRGHGCSLGGHWLFPELRIRVRSRSCYGYEHESTAPGRASALRDAVADRKARAKSRPAKTPRY